MSDSGNIAAWVQAIGSIVAIGVAIYVPWKQHQREIKQAEKTDQLKARALAHSIDSSFYALRAKTRGVQKGFRSHFKECIEKTEYNKIRLLRINFSDNLERHMPELWMLGATPSIPVIKAISLARSFDEMVEKLADDLNAGRRRRDETLELEGKFEVALVEICEYCDQGIEALKALTGRGPEV